MPYPLPRPQARPTPVVRYGSHCLCIAAVALLPLSCVNSGSTATRGNAPTDTAVSTAATAASAPTDAATAVLTIDATKPRQRLDGFGAATAYYQNWIVSHPNKAALYDALFKDLKLDILRLQNVWRPTKGPDFAKDDIDIVQGAKTSLGHPITLLMTSWSPPGSLKSNGSEKNGGTLARDKAGAYVYGGFADYWHDSLLAYRKIGISPTFVSIQNEPDWKADWESCLFEPTEKTRDGQARAGYGHALDAVFTRLSTLPNAPSLVGPETLGIGYGNPQNYLDPQKDKARIDRLYAVAHHLYSGGDHKEPDSFLPRMHSIRDDYPAKPRWMTEFGRSDGFQTAWIIHNSLVEEEASAYIYWAALWPDDDCLISIDNPWDRAKWKYPDGYRLNDRYWAIKHYSFFTAPGYRRVETATADSALKASAFLSPDRDWLIVVALNTSDTQTKTLTLDLKGFSRGNSATATQAYRTIFPPAGAATGAEMPEKFKDLGPLDANGSVSLPPRSIVTFTLNGQGSAAL